MDLREKLEYPLPKLALSCKSLVLEIDSEADVMGAVAIKNAGGGRLSGHIITPAKSLVFEPEKFDGNRQKVTVSYRAAAAEIGPGQAKSYTAQILSTGGDAELNIEIRPAPPVGEPASPPPVPPAPPKPKIPFKCYLPREGFTLKDAGIIVIESTDAVQVEVFCKEHFVQLEGNRFEVLGSLEIPFKIKPSPFTVAQMLFRKQPALFAEIEVSAAYGGKSYKRMLTLTAGEF